MKKILLLLLLTLGLASQTDAKPYLVTGRMEYVAGLEGGCWYLGAEDGQKYQLIGSQDQMEQVHVIGRNLKLQVEDANVASTCMVGKPVRIVKVVQNFGYPVDLAYVTVKASGKVMKTKAGCWYLKTTKGQKYDLQLEEIPKKKRKNGAKVKNQYFRIFMDKKASQCSFDGTAMFVPAPAPNSRAMEKKPADPR
jgi:hypothetical protein